MRCGDRYSTADKVLNLYEVGPDSVSGTAYGVQSSLTSDP